MKISVISTLPPIKGISNYTKGLVEELSKEVEIEFYGFKSIYPEKLYPGGTKTNEPEPKINNVHIHNYLTWYNPFSWIYTGFKINTKIIHAQWWSWVTSPIYLTILSIARLKKKKVILTVHNVKPHEKSFIKNLLNKSVLNLANEYIVHSENNKELFLQETKTKKKIHVIPHGMIELKKSDKTVKELKKEYNLGNEKIILFFGNIRDYKGLDNLIESLSLMKNDKIKLIIAGQSWEEFTKYNNLIKKLNLENNIIKILKYIPDEKAAEIFKLSDLVVCPYKEFEASSGVTSLVLNFEKPLVVTNVGGLTDNVKDKKVIALPNNPKDLKDKLEYALKNLKKLEKDTKEIKKKFLWSNIAKKTVEVYNGNTN